MSGVAEHVRQFAARFAQLPERARDAAVGGDEPNAIRSPWLTSAEGAELVRCPTRRAFREWAQRAGIIPIHRGRTVLYTRADVLDALTVQRVTVR